MPDFFCAGNVSRAEIHKLPGAQLFVRWCSFIVMQMRFGTHVVWHERLSVSGRRNEVRVGQISNSRTFVSAKAHWQRQEDRYAKCALSCATESSAVIPQLDCRNCKRSNPVPEGMRRQCIARGAVDKKRECLTPSSSGPAGRNATTADTAPGRSRPWPAAVRKILPIPRRKTLPDWWRHRD